MSDEYLGGSTVDDVSIRLQTMDAGLRPSIRRRKQKGRPEAALPSLEGNVAYFGPPSLCTQIPCECVAA